MEGMKMEEPSLTPTEDADICTSILTRFGNSTREDHQHLCAVIGGMGQGFKDQNIPSSPVAYFGAAFSSLDRLLSEPEPSSGHMVDALLTILSMAMCKVSPAILVKKSNLLTRILLLSDSNSLTVAGAISALKCISHLLILNNNNNNWSQLYGFLLSFATDSRSKVRRQSHLRLRDVLQSFQGTWQLALASAGIADLFKRFLVLASGKDTQGLPKGAMEMLFVLDCLKECIALMSSMCKSDVLHQLKSLLELNQPPLVTRRIADILYRLCLNPCPDVAPQILLDLLCSLSLSVSNMNERSSVDDMTFKARLLHVVMAKVYSLNKQMCVIKLPTVFNALRDILGSKHEEATHAAVNTFKSLIHACIDESLIKEGVDQFVMMNERRSGQTIIEKVCATIENLVGYHYTPVLDLASQVVSAMFDKLGVYSCYFMRGTLKILADMAKLPDEAFLCRKQLHECLGTALVAMGPETFLGFLPLNLEAEDPSEVNVWLFPILKQYTIGARLSFFTESILGMVEVMSNKSQQLIQSQGRIFSSRCTDELIYSLWSLLPSFCNYPSDTAESFNDLKQALCRALRKKPEIRRIICLSLQILVQQNKKIPEEVNDLSDSEVGSAKKRAMANYTHQVTADNLSVLKSSAHKILTVLSDVFLETTKDESTKDDGGKHKKDDGGKHTKDDGGCLQSTIGEFASIADEQTLAQLLLDKSKDRNSMKRALLFDLAVSFLPGLDAKAVDVLFTNLIKPGLQHAGGLIQKKAYKALSIILGDFDGFISSKLEELLGLMVELLPSCHFSARRHRLDCLYLLIVHVSKSETEQRRHDIISSFLTEIILGLKETNKKTRNKAYYTLVQIGHIYGDEEKGGTKENLHQFFNMVAGRLAGETPVIISAAMRGLARLAYEFSDLVSTASNLLPSTFLLLQRKNKEIIKASLCLLKVLVAKSQAEGLQLHLLKSMVEALLKWQDDTKTNFKAKVNLLLEMLVRKCGLDAVKAVMPQEHMKLLTNIRKIKERKERKQQASKFEDAKSLASRATTARLSRWNHSKVFSDFDDEETDDYMDAQTVTGRCGKASRLKSKACSLRSKCSTTNKKLLADHLFDQLEDEPLGLLDGPRTMSALGSLKRKMESDEEPEIDPDGRLVIGEEANSKPSHPDSDSWSEAGTKKIRKRRKTSECGWASSGNVYGSNKAGVDLKKKKDKLFEPYAYWALDRKMMSSRPEHRAAARKGISSILSSKRFKFKRVHKRKISK